MKLFAVACLTGATAQNFGSGDYDGDRGAVSDSDYYNAYDNYDEFGNKKNKKNQNQWFSSGGKNYDAMTLSSGSDWAAALNCWPSNIEADSLVAPNHRHSGGSFETSGSRDPTTYPTQSIFNFAPQHVYGSQEVGYRAIQRQALTAHGETTLHQEDPVVRSGLGGQYQYGHDTYNSATHNPDLDGNGSLMGTQWRHYHQARHAGCLYEKEGWHYSHDNFDKVFVATYYQGYSDFTGANPVDAFVTAAASDAGAGPVEPVWWHFFNAHILPNSDGSGATFPVSQTRPDVGSYKDPALQNSIPLVMANPAYEGLGYLNFVVEYKYKDVGIAQDYEEFIDSSPGGIASSSSSFQAKATYRAINDCQDGGDAQECSGYGAFNDQWDGVHGHYYYDLYMGSWSIAKSEDPDNSNKKREWVTYPIDGSGNSVRDRFNDDTVSSFAMDSYTPAGSFDWSDNYDMVVSSFPHNNLGKDFRFNLRILMGTKTGQNAPNSSAFSSDTSSKFFSYYIYKINEIHIQFPFNVAYALYHEGRHGATNTGNRISGVSSDTGAVTDAWWRTINNDNDNHPAHLSTAGDASTYTKQLDADPLQGNDNGRNVLANSQDYQFMHRSASDDNKNIIPPVDLGTHAPNDGNFHRIKGFIDSPASHSNAPDWCDANDAGRNVNLERTCGTNFYIKGLMNTYDERRGQRGTYQEIWVQLQYAIGADGRGQRASCRSQDELGFTTTVDGDCTTDNPVQSPWPYLHFMASEIVSIQATCNSELVNNANTCGPQPVGAGRPNDAFYGGK